MHDLKFNKCQTPLTHQKTEELKALPHGSDILSSLLYDINSIMFIKNMISVDRLRARDLPKDSKGRIEVNLTNPHILEDMDYFRERAIHYKTHGCYTFLMPNPNPRSEFAEFWAEEKRRCIEGYVRESDGEWIPGYYYYYLNYSPIMLNIIEEGTKRADRILDFPDVFDGDYFYFHYIEQAEVNGQHGCVLKTRGRGYSFKGAALAGRNVHLLKNSKSYMFAFEKEYLEKDGLATKAWDNMDYIATATPWPKLRKINTMLHKRLGYVDSSTGTEKGMKSEIMAISLKDNPNRSRGKRGKVILFEEAGKFPQLDRAWGICRMSVEDGGYTFGTMIAFGTGGCLTAGNKVWDNKGNLINIEDVTKETGIIGFKNGFNKEPVTWLQPPSNKECVKITTNTGRILECSTDHPIYKALRTGVTNITKNHFVEAVNLNIGDLIGVIENVDIWSNIELNHARAIGMIIGDGTYGSNQTTRFANADKELFDYLEERFELKTLRTHITKDGRLYKEVRIKDFNKYLRACGVYGQTKTNKRLPVNIHSYSKTSVFELIGGLFDTDGYVSIRENKARPGKKICEVSIAQASLELIRELQLLLQKLGIHSSIRTRMLRKTNPKDRNPWYELSIRDGKSLQVFSENVTLLVVNKQSRLTEIKNYVKTINFNKSSHEGLRYEKVISVEKTGIKPVYNLTAGNSNTYIGNGIITHNTEGADFEALSSFFYEPDGRNIYGIPNVFDRNLEGATKVGFFSPEYLNRKNNYDHNGNSDVIGALIELHIARARVKYGTTDPNALVYEMADRPITPQEAVLRKEGSVFPVKDLKDYSAEISPQMDKFLAKHYVGRISLKPGNKVEFVLDESLVPLRKYPLQANDINKEGAIELFELPIAEPDKIPYFRYIAGIDPINDDDIATVVSLGSIFIFDTFTKRIVAEYTGRPRFVEDFYETCRRMLMLYNATANYESKQKGLYAHFKIKDSLHLLADTPKILKDMGMLTKSFGGLGNSSKGTIPTNEINAWGRRLQASWMLSDAYSMSDTDKKTNIWTLRSIAYIQEAIAWNPDGNFDRVSAMNMVMIYLKNIERYIDDMNAASLGLKEQPEIGPRDPFFKRNFQKMRKNRDPQLDAKIRLGLI